VGLKFAAVTVQLSAFNVYTMNPCGSGSPGAGPTAKGAGQIDSTPSETHTRRSAALVCQSARVFVYGTGGFGWGAGILILFYSYTRNTKILDSRAARTESSKCRTEHGQAA
jgi:hypothetical protein